jgi:hypothetical protein
MHGETQLRIAHVTALAAVAGWMAWAHPGGWVPAVAVALVACGSELLPRGAWRELGAPAATLAAAVGAWLAADPGRGAVHAMLGTLVSALLLIPARPGVLRMVAPLAVAELAVLGLPGVAGPPAAVAAWFLAPLAVAALAADAWLEARLGARPGGRRAAWLAWAAVPALCAGALGAAALQPATAIAEAVRPAPVRRDPARAERPPPTPGERPGDRLGVEPGGPPPRDPSPAARLFMPAQPDGLVYLRLAACSRLIRDLDGGRLRWTPAPGEVELPDRPEPPAGAMIGGLVRMPGLGDAVLLPDDGDWIGLDGLWADGDGNRWRPDLGLAVRSYRVALAGGTRREPPADLALARSTARELPPAIADWPWRQIQDPAWTAMPIERAAEAIGRTLRARCAYDLDPPQVDGEPLHAFLFGPDRQRRGVCGHFAGAAAILLRQAGHPARVVAGYASAEWDGGGVLFRRLHAHAWVELLTPEGVWQRFDPTPPVAHDLVAAGADRGVEPPREDQAVPLPPSVRSQRRSVLYGALIVLLAAGTVLVVVLLRRRRRRHDPQVVFRRRGEELVELARAHGVRVVPGDTAATICAALAARTGVDLQPALAAYEAARFGGGPPPPPWPETLRRRPASG